MNANELRVGNYVYFPFTKEVVKILGINAHENNGKIENSISFMNGLNLYCEKVDKLQSIKLTEEWLLKFDLEQINRFSFRFKIGKGNINYFYKSNKIRFNHHEIDLHIKYVHQLQNLYFALTGEELVFSDVVS